MAARVSSNTRQEQLPTISPRQCLRHIITNHTYAPHTRQRLAIHNRSNTLLSTGTKRRHTSNRNPTTNYTFPHVHCT